MDSILIRAKASPPYGAVDSVRGMRDNQWCGQLRVDTLAQCSTALTMSLAVGDVGPLVGCRQQTREVDRCLRGLFTLACRADLTLKDL